MGRREYYWTWGQVLRAWSSNFPQRARHSDILGGEIERAPSLQAAGERAHPSKSCSSQLKRHTGAGRFVRSSAVKNYVVIGRDFARVRAQVVGTQKQSSRKLYSLALHFSRMPQIHDLHGRRCIQKI
jgi:hypothetical protein